MTFEVFNQVIELLKKEDEKLHTLYKLDIDLYNFCDNMQKIITMLLRSHYSFIGEDIISWWLYEDTEKILYNKDGDVVDDLTSIEDLWKYVEDLRKSSDFIEYIPTPDMTEQERQDILMKIFK